VSGESVLAWFTLWLLLKVIVYQHAQLYKTSVVVGSFFFRNVEATDSCLIERPEDFYDHPPL